MCSPPQNTGERRPLTRIVLKTPESDSKMVADIYRYRLGALGPGQSLRLRNSASLGSDRKFPMRRLASTNPPRQFLRDLWLRLHPDPSTPGRY
jgi:hypothetical protein